MTGFLIFLGIPIACCLGIYGLWFLLRWLFDRQDRRHQPTYRDGGQ